MLNLYIYTVAKRGDSQFTPKAKSRPTKRARQQRQQHQSQSQQQSQNTPQPEDPDALPPTLQPEIQQQQQQKPQTRRFSGIPILVGPPTGIPNVTGAANRRPSVISPPASTRTRLESLTAPTIHPSSETEPSSAIAERRGVRIAEPIVVNKRPRLSSSAPEAAPETPPKIKTFGDYALLGTKEIDQLPISFFCQNTKHGRPTQEFIDRDNENIRRLLAPERSASKDEEPEEEEEKEESSAEILKKEEEGPPVNRMAAQVRIVDGKVVIDTESLVVSRRDMAGKSNEPLELVDESSRNRFINSQTYVRQRTSRKRWTKDETELFYQALHTYGSDFEMIASVTPGRNRYDIKNKFKMEEKKNGTRVTYALLVRRSRPPSMCSTPAPDPDPDSATVEDE